MSLMTKDEFEDALDARIDSYNEEEWPEQESYITDWHTVVSGPKEDWRYSEKGTFADWPIFTGNLEYQTMYEGYDGTITPLIFASGFQVDQTLDEDNLWGDFEMSTRGLMQALWRTREKDAHAWLTRGFTNDTKFNVISEGVPLFSSAHTNRSGFPTTTGYDNAGVTALSAAAVAATFKVMAKQLDSRGNRIRVRPDTISCGTQNYDIAAEIVKSQDKSGTANRTHNVHAGQYTIEVSQYFNVNENDWAMSDSRLRKQNLLWFEKKKADFGRTEAFENFQYKIRGRARWGCGHRNWRGMHAHDVA